MGHTEKQVPEEKIDFCVIFSPLYENHLFVKNTTDNFFQWCSQERPSTPLPLLPRACRRYIRATNNILRH
jgi:hypothetical protein